MSRGGRGGRGGKRGPDLSWDDEETTADQTLDTPRPQPLFPQRYIATPKPLSSADRSSVSSFISFRDRVRRGPLYAVLDPTIITSSDSTAHARNGLSHLRKTQQTVAKSNPRAGFDPFNDQEKYTLKYHRKRRTCPDLTERECYTLKLFPMELWSVLDPKRKMPEWDGLTEEQKARMSSNTGATGKGTKRKRAQALKFDEDDDGDGTKKPVRGDDSEGSDEEDEDVLTGRRKKKEKEKKKGATGKQKKGLDAEDDYPEVDQQDDDVEGDGAGEEEPQDSEFGTDEEDDEGGDDYNAEQYFDDGADDFGDGDGGDDDGGGVF